MGTNGDRSWGHTLFSVISPLTSHSVNLTQTRTTRDYGSRLNDSGVCRCIIFIFPIIESIDDFVFYCHESQTDGLVVLSWLHILIGIPWVTVLNSVLTSNY